MLSPLLWLVHELSICCLHSCGADSDCRGHGRPPRAAPRGHCGGSLPGPGHHSAARELWQPYVRHEREPRRGEHGHGGARAGECSENASPNVHIVAPTIHIRNEPTLRHLQLVPTRQRDSHSEQRAP
eukprot:1182132-Prorocentrum_minimum.AAC.1